MGFSGGGSNVLLPHTHDGTVSQDGGPLDFNNITQSQSASGQIFYSDGAHLQQLSPGAPNDELRVSAGNLPEWHTPAAAGSTWDIIYNSGVTGGAGPINTGTFSAPDRWLKICGYVGTVSSTVSGVTCNQTNGALEYALQFQRNFATTGSANAEGSLWYLSGFNTSEFNYFETDIYNGSETADKLAHTVTVANPATGANAPTTIEYYSKWYGGAYITRLDLCNSGGVAHDYQAGSHLLVLATG